VATKRGEGSVQLSVLDRLIDGSGSTGSSIGWSDSVRILKAAVLRDLEWILNTRRTLELAPSAYPEVQQSVYHYGLPDISSMSREDETVRTHLPRHIATAIQLFEPRLTSVRVTSVTGSHEDRSVRFTVEALLLMDPNPERIVFDTLLEPSRGEFQIQEGSDA
jgi:type VI secretion system protein ImpF